MSKQNTPLEMFYHWEKNHPDDVFLRQSHGENGWEELSWRQVADKARRVANFIRSQALPPKSNIAVWSSNSADWVIVDLAIMLSGCVSVPLYPGQSTDAVKHILEETECSLIFLGQFDQEEKVNEAVTEGVKRVGIHGCLVQCSYSIDNIVNEHQPLSDSPVPEPSETMTIAYSSGTGGQPKGVMHSHQTPASITPIIARLFGIIAAEDGNGANRAKLFSFLPLAHMAERALVWMTGLYGNAVISFSSGLDSFSREIQEVQPTFFFAVPRLWFKFKAGIESQLGVFDPNSLPDDNKALIRQKLGLANARFVISGSAPIPPVVQKWFLDLGVTLRECYGMTETFATGTCWHSNNEPVAGSVGTAHEGVEVKLSDEGEVLIRSKGMMKGYYKNQQFTEKVLENGWFHTGDLGEFASDGSLKITGRMGSIFKTSKGKFVNPERVEKQLHSVTELEQLIMVGDGLELPVAVATLSENALKEAPEVLKARITSKLEIVNQNLPSEEAVSKLFIVPDRWTIDDGFLTPTSKLKRSRIISHYLPYLVENETKERVVFLGTQTSIDA